MNRNILAASLLLALTPARADTTAGDELAAIRQQIEALRAEYETRIHALETRLQQVQTDARSSPPMTEQNQAASAPSRSTATPPTQSRSMSTDNAANRFNPAVSAILTGTYGQFSHDPDSYAIPGFALGEETGPGERGFSLGESELNLSANIDNQFFGSLTVALTPDGEAEIEEAYAQTTALPQGFTLKFGRFFSGLGYLNEQHAHVWDFVDSPLVYRALLGNQYGDDGLQVRWLAATDLFLEFGAEWLRGEHFPAGGAADNGRGSHSAFMHLGGDLGASHSWRFGLSHLRSEAAGRESGDTPDSFDGDSRISSADFVWKWAPQGNATRTHFKFQAEYFQRSEDGLFNGLDYNADQNGWYSQAIYQFMPRWRVGARYDRLQADDPGLDFAGTVLDTLGHDPQRSSLMVDFSNSEFSRLRLQYSRDESQPVRDNQVFLQYIMSIGAHSGHQY